MQLYRSQNVLLPVIATVLCAVTLLTTPGLSRAADAAAKSFCPNDDSGLTLPAGFCATIFADGIGHARHMAVAANGVVYVNTWSGRYFGNDTPHAGGFLVALQDTTGSGKADINQRFGETVQSGAAGGTGIGIYNGWLYAELNDKIIKFKLNKAAALPDEKSQIVVGGLPLGGDHPMHPFAIDAAGGLYVDVASATNSCQEKNRTLRSPGIDPCTELETRGGIWLYKRQPNKSKVLADRALRDRHTQRGWLWARWRRSAYLCHSAWARSAAHELARYHEARAGSNAAGRRVAAAEKRWRLRLAEVLLRRHRRADWCWRPSTAATAKTQGICAQKSAPAAAFPAHWAPNDMLLYSGKGFPAHYRKGEFIAFHGSWNRAPFR